MRKFFRKIVSTKTLLILAILFVIGGCVGSTIYYYNKYQKVKKDPEIISREETAWLVEKVSKLIIIPSGTPTIATVLDKSKLQDQDFFKSAENGDKILVFESAKKAVLYRPSVNKIVEISPLVTNTARVNIINGSSNDIATDDALSKLKNISDIRVTNANAKAKKNYSQTMVIDLTGAYSSQAEEIANALGGKTGSLPAGEEKPDADILVIVAE